MVGLSAMSNYQLAELAGEVGVARAKIQCVLKELANIRVRSGDCTLYSFVSFRTMEGYDAYLIGLQS
jgi:hypothetical protein